MWSWFPLDALLLHLMQVDPLGYWAFKALTSLGCYIDLGSTIYICNNHVWTLLNWEA